MGHSAPYIILMAGDMVILNYWICGIVEGYQWYNNMH